jgi:hypothetical protein
MTPADNPNRWELRIGSTLVADSAEPKPAPWVPVYAARRLGVKKSSTWPRMQTWDVKRQAGRWCLSAPAMSC